MADEKLLNQAQKVYQTICKAMNEDGWKCQKDDENLVIETNAQGDGLPIELFVDVEAERQIVQVLSRLPIKIPDDRRLDAALAVCAVNDKLAHGCFDFSVEKGTLFFRMSSSFRDSDIDGEAYLYMLYISCRTIDKYSDKFFMLGKGLLTVEKFLETM